MTKRALRLTATQITQLGARYQAGAGVVELGLEFGVNRKTVSEVPEPHGVTMPNQPPSHEMIRLYATASHRRTSASEWASQQSPSGTGSRHAACSYGHAAAGK